MASQEALPQDTAALPPGTVHLFSCKYNLRLESSRIGRKEPCSHLNYSTRVEQKR